MYKLIIIDIFRDKTISIMNKIVENAINDKFPIVNQKAQIKMIKLLWHYHLFISSRL